MLRPLAPGEPTWPELLAAAEQQKAAEASAEAALVAASQVRTVCDGLCRLFCRKITCACFSCSIA